MRTTDRTLYSSAARTATPAAAEQGGDYRGAHIVIDVTASAATPSVVFKVEGFDAASGSWYEILASAAVTGVSKTLLTVFPGADKTANVSANAALPRKWRLAATHADADSITYTAGAFLFD